MYCLLTIVNAKVHDHVSLAGHFHFGIYYKIKSLRNIFLDDFLFFIFIKFSWFIIGVLFWFFPPLGLQVGIWVYGPYGNL